jgi:hypothetical protein
MSRRRPSKPGLSYFEANRGRLVTIEEDVLGIKAEIERRWPTLEVYLDKEHFENGDPAYIVVEKCTDGVERLVGEYPTLDRRVIERLEAADNHIRGQEDPLAIVDAYNAQVEREHERKFEDAIGAANERLIWALQKDGVDAGIPKVFFKENVVSNR